MSNNFRCKIGSHTLSVTKEEIKIVCTYANLKENMVENLVCIYISKKYNYLFF